MDRNNKLDLFNAFRSAAKLAKNLNLALTEKKVEKTGLVLDSDLPALPEFRTEAVEWDYDLLEVILPQPKVEAKSGQMDLARMAADAERLSEDCLNEAIDLEEARQILCHVAESLDLVAEQYLTEETVKIDFSEPFVLTQEIQELSEKYGFDDDYEFLDAEEAEAYLNSSSLEHDVVAKLKPHVIREMRQTQDLILKRPAQAEFQECAEEFISKLSGKIAQAGSVSEELLEKLMSAQIHEESGFEVWISVPGSEVELFKPKALKFTEFELDQMANDATYKTRDSGLFWAGVQEIVSDGGEYWSALRFDQAVRVVCDLMTGSNAEIEREAKAWISENISALEESDAGIESKGEAR